MTASGGRRNGVKLDGRRGIYWTEDGFFIERDEQYPDVAVWLVSLPREHNPGEERQPVTTLGLDGATKMVIETRRILNGRDAVCYGPALDKLGFTPWPVAS